MFYFAYGSNLDRHAMVRRCPRSRPFATAQLTGYRFAFHRFATIVADPTASVTGALYRVTPACVHALDLYEEVPELYRKLSIDVRTDDAIQQAFTYIMTDALPRGARTPPDLAYFNEVNRGYADWELDQKLLQRARLACLHQASAARGSARSPDGREPS